MTKDKNDLVRNQTTNEEIAVQEQFLKYHNKLREQLTIANWSFKTCKYFTSAYKDYKNEIDDSPYFFNLTIFAHIISTIVRLNTLLDRRTHLGMDLFLDFVKKHRKIFSKQAVEKRLQEKGIYDKHWIKNHLEVTPDIVEQHRKTLHDLPRSALRRWRNKLVVHIGVDTVLQNTELGKKYPIRTQHVEKIIGKLHEILNYYLIAYEGRSFSEGLDFEYEIKNILQAIRFDLQRRREAANLAIRISRESK